MLESLYPISSQGLFITALISSIYWLRPYVWIILGIVIVCLLIPIDKLPLWFYLRAILGDISISLSIICGWFLWGHRDYAQAHKPMNQNAKVGIKNHRLAVDWLQLCWLYTFFGFLLYPFALGLSSFDPYALGYHHWLLIGFLSALVLTYYLTQKAFLCFLFASVLLAYSLNILESENLWDYLLDPLLFIVCMFHILKILPVALFRFFWVRYHAS